MIDLSLHKKHFEIDAKQNKVIVCKDKGNTSKYTLNNNSEFTISKIKIDNGVFDSKDGIKCDYLLQTIKQNKTEHLFLIELKGKQILKAIDQVQETLNRLQITKKSANKVFGRIVPTGTHSPDVRSINYLKLNDRFKSLAGNLISKTQNFDTI